MALPFLEPFWSRSTKRVRRWKSSLETLMTALGLMRLSPLDRGFPQHQAGAGKEAEGTEVPGRTGQPRAREAPRVARRAGASGLQKVETGGDASAQAERRAEPKISEARATRPGGYLLHLLRLRGMTLGLLTSMRESGKNSLASDKMKKTKEGN